MEPSRKRPLERVSCSGRVEEVLPPNEKSRRLRISDGTASTVLTAWLPHDDAEVLEHATVGTLLHIYDAKESTYYNGSICAHQGTAIKAGPASTQNLPELTTGLMTSIDLSNKQTITIENDFGPKKILPVNIAAFSQGPELATFLGEVVTVVVCGGYIQSIDKQHTSATILPGTAHLTETTTETTPTTDLPETTTETTDLTATATETTATDLPETTTETTDLTETATETTATTDLTATTRETTETTELTIEELLCGDE